MKIKYRFIDVVAWILNLKNMRGTIPNFYLLGRLGYLLDKYNRKNDFYLGVKIVEMYVGIIPKISPTMMKKNMKDSIDKCLSEIEELNN